MNIKILAVGKIKDAALTAKCQEYAKKISFDTKLEIVEIKDSDKESEGVRLSDHIEKNRGRTILLDEHGKHFSSVAFADMIATSTEPITFVIGGPTGLSTALQANFREKMCLSAMTFTHEMARMFLLEQIYRAFSIVKKRPYHKE